MALADAFVDFVALPAPVIFARLPERLALGFGCATSVGKVDLRLDALPLGPKNLEDVSSARRGCSLSARKRSIAYSVTVFGLVLLFETWFSGSAAGGVSSTAVHAVVGSAKSVRFLLVVCLVAAAFGAKFFSWPASTRAKFSIKPQKSRLAESGDSETRFRSMTAVS